MLEIGRERIYSFTVTEKFWIGESDASHLLITTVCARFRSLAGHIQDDWCLTKQSASKKKSGKAAGQHSLIKRGTNEGCFSKWIRCFFPFLPDCLWEDLSQVPPLAGGLPLTTNVSTCGDKKCLLYNEQDCQNSPPISFQVFFFKRGIHLSRHG